MKKRQETAKVLFYMLSKIPDGEYADILKIIIFVGNCKGGS